MDPREPVSHEVLAPKRKPNRRRPGKNLSLPPEKVAIWQALADAEKMKLARWIERAADAWTAANASSA